MPRCPVLVVVLLVPALAACADKPVVVELFEDDTDTLIAQLTRGGISGGEDVMASAEAADVFTGKVALRVAPAQRFNPDVKGWDFPIVERPKAGEYRFLRFAWKKVGAGPLMIQFHTRGPRADWLIRYHAGQEPALWTATVVAPAAPGDWTVVTRDLFKDFGAVSLGGVAFSPLAGSDGLFDHLLLGPSVEDLDHATAAALLKMPPRPLTGAQFRELWNNLGSTDEPTGSTAVWNLLAGRTDAVPHLLRTASVPDRKVPSTLDEAKVKPFIENLKHYRYVVRQAAADELFKLGDGVVPHLRKAVTATDGEAKARLQAALDAWDVRTGSDVRRLRRCAAVLRYADVPEGRDLLSRIERALP